MVYVRIDSKRVQSTDWSGVGVRLGSPPGDPLSHDDAADRIAIEVRNGMLKPMSLILRLIRCYANAEDLRGTNENAGQLVMHTARLRAEAEPSPAEAVIGLAGGFRPGLAYPKPEAEP